MPSSDGYAEGSSSAVLTSKSHAEFPDSEMVTLEGKAEAIELTARVSRTPSSPVVNTVSIQGDDLEMDRMSRMSSRVSHQTTVSELPPVDRGFGAWSFVSRKRPVAKLQLH